MYEIKRAERLSAGVHHTLAGPARNDNCPADSGSTTLTEQTLQETSVGKKFTANWMMMLEIIGAQCRVRREATGCTHAEKNTSRYSCARPYSGRTTAANVQTGTQHDPTTGPTNNSHQPLLTQYPLSTLETRKRGVMRVKRWAQAKWACFGVMP